MRHLQLMVYLAGPVLARFHEENNQSQSQSQSQDQSQEPLKNIGIFIASIACSLLLCCCCLEWCDNKPAKQDADTYPHGPFINYGSDSDIE